MFFRFYGPSVSTPPKLQKALVMANDIPFYLRQVKLLVNPATSTPRVANDTPTIKAAIRINLIILKIIERFLII